MKKVSVIIDGGEYAISYERKGEQEVEFKVYVSDPALLAKTGAMFTFAVSVNEDKGFSGESGAGIHEINRAKIIDKILSNEGLWLDISSV